MAHYFCKCCGTKANSISSLLSRRCENNPLEKRHMLYEGGQKIQYHCEYCSARSSNMTVLCVGRCNHNPNGEHHIPKP
ncbi:hypothetical protein KRE40_11240 [Elizabethkingia meningoseptica]|uniref:hypothetical protein n=1 Tax=Elizabethkingia TaxID=308865 RepID=UPI000937DFF8|nr:MULTISPECIES: hypothetical protein [Elizabethkingia]MBG0512465.1 hypothetical protein [Elizabethkingia meningoseptica]MDE5435067.1 hypothetical protein [Elizabethkingia meningoseptica]MDE5439222.1 hypothetical protein [Elizabethkingia meningoseptica]MDE5449025.1 hypothetical protein [Elizabethkingia meningoseptica]MDE5472287.1 hypothetical protein [Elizabethkingia meningoseptica]